jgi:hypothetical protein
VELAQVSVHQVLSAKVMASMLLMQTHVWIVALALTLVLQVLSLLENEDNLCVFYDFKRHSLVSLPLFVYLRTSIC